MKKLLVLALALMLIHQLDLESFAQYRFELTPFISAGLIYDDNIYLDNTDEISDYVATVTPGASLSVTGQHTDLRLRYAPTFVRYRDLDDENTTRHSASLVLGQDLTERLRFNLTDSFLRSDDPLEDITDLQGLRRGRNKYSTNTGQGSLSYRFGPENMLNVGYSHQYRKNDDPTLEDSTVQEPFADLTYWLNVQNGIELRYRYTDVEYKSDEPAFSTGREDDYTGHRTGVRYIRRFSPKSQGYVGYNYTTRDFDGLTEEYDVHDAFLGLEHIFSPEYSMAASAGYFVRVNDVSENEDGPIFSALLTRAFERGRITIGGDGGWGEEYLSTTVMEAGGFTKYYSGYLSGRYQLLEPVSTFAGLSYRHDKKQNNRTWHTWRANCGLHWAFLRWFSLSLSYTYVNRRDDIEISNYTDNRVMLTLSASKSYVW
ncbi:MAG: outer membrane beta-barrel protein [Deltaproteobacteria bacterium]|nr:outer membrane beta-barrel protein [Deltaproteobacteria bacterium]